MQQDFKADYFDEDFYRCNTGTKGLHRRDVNHDVYKWFSERVHDCLKDTDCKTMLDIGAGIGIRTTNHIANGYDAYPCDVSTWACQNSVLPDKHYIADVRDLDRIKRNFDVVIAERVLGYIPKEDSFKALKEVVSKARKFVFLSIICSDHRDQQIPITAKPGRINIQPRKFWEDLLNKIPNIELDIEKTKKMLKDDWDCLYVYKKLSILFLVCNILEAI